MLLMKRILVGALALIATGAAGVAFALSIGVPTAFVPQICGTPSATSVVFCLQTGLNQAVPFIAVNPTTHQVEIAPPTSMLRASTNAALAGWSLPIVPLSIRRDGFYAAGDGGAADYTYSATACAAADNGAQVAGPSGGCWIASIPGNVFDIRVWGAKADGATDATAAINATAAYAGKMGGGKVLIPPPNVVFSAKLTAPNNVSLEGMGQNASLLTTPASFLTGDAISLGDYSHVRYLSIQGTPTAAEAATGELPYRTSGCDIAMNGGYQSVEHVSIRHAFNAICMNTTGGENLVRDVAIEYLADGGTANPNSGGIVIDNTSIGPTNRIESVNIKPNIGDSIPHLPDFGLRVYNSGALIARSLDITGLRRSVDIVPGTGQTVQASLFSDSYFDGAQGDNVVIRSVGGFVVHTTFENCWNTVTGGAGSRGYVLVGAGTPAPYPGGRAAPIMDTKIDGGVIAATMGLTSSGVYVDPYAVDTTVTHQTITGWNAGLEAAPGAGHITYADNAVGNYGIFAATGATAPTTPANNYAFVADSGPGDYIDVHDNRMSGNLQGPISNGAAGIHNRIHDNPGYNPVGASNVTLGGSPQTLGPLPTPASLGVFGGAGVAVTTGNPAVTVLSGNGTVELPAGQAVSLSYTSAPTVTINVH